MAEIDINNNHEIIVLLKSGKESVFDDVYLFYYSRICAFASQYVETSDAEGIVQEVMIWLWENRTKLLPEMSLKSLLFTMVKNKCLNSLNHVRVRRKVQDKLYEKFSQQFEDPDFYVYEELLTRVSEAIEKLPEEYKKSFKMNRFDDMTYNDIAKVSGVSPKTIAYRITQALKILRIELKDYLPLLIWLLHD